jgi:hypothetical protein
VLGAGGAPPTFDSGSTGGAQDLGDAHCGQSSIQAAAKPVNILLVIDKSGSMTPPPPATDKWAALRAALPPALDPVKGGISLGMILFPNNLATPIPALGPTARR